MAYRWYRNLWKSRITEGKETIRFFHQSHNTVLFGGLFTLKQWIISSLKHDTVPRVNKLYCFYVKNPPKRIALWDRENSQWPNQPRSRGLGTRLLPNPSTNRGHSSDREQFFPIRTALGRKRKRVYFFVQGCSERA